MKLDINELNNIINFENDEYHYAIVFTNVEDSLMDDIKEKLEDNVNATNLIIDMRSFDLSNIDKLKSTISSDLDSNLITKMLLESKIYEHLINQLLKKYSIKYNKVPNKNSNTIDFNQIDIDNIFIQYELESLSDLLKRKDNTNITINIFVNEQVPLNVQSILNNLLNDRYTYHTRIYTTEDELKTYYTTSDGFLEEMHDYHERSLKDIKHTKVKSK